MFGVILPVVAEFHLVSMGKIFVYPNEILVLWECLPLMKAYVEFPYFSLLEVILNNLMKAVLRLCLNIVCIESFIDGMRIKKIIIINIFFYSLFKT